jgi:hypothetical protein
MYFLFHLLDPVFKCDQLSRMIRNVSRIITPMFGEIKSHHHGTNHRPIEITQLFYPELPDLSDQVALILTASRSPKIANNCSVP